MAERHTTESTKKTTETVESAAAGTVPVVPVVPVDPNAAAVNEAIAEQAHETATAGKVEITKEERDA